MPRPPRKRTVEFVPEVNYFKPAGIPLRKLEEVVLSVEELEAIRLKDTEGLDQHQAADRMNVSRSTFQLTLTSAREKVSHALVQGKAIRIDGGTYQVKSREKGHAKGSGKDHNQSPGKGPGPQGGHGTGPAGPDNIF